MSSLNIIHILPVIRTGGGVILLQQILSNISDKTKNQVWAHRIEENLRFKNTKLKLTKHANLVYFPKIIIELIKQKKENTIIHVHGRNGFLVFLAAKFLKIRVVYQAHGYYYKLLKNNKFSFLNYFVDYFILKFTDLVIFCSESEKDFVIKNYALKNNHVVIQNSIKNLKKGKPQIKNPEKINIIYCLGTSNIYQKGIDLQLKLAKELLKLIKNFKIIHFFNFQNHKEKMIIEKNIKKLGLSNHYFLQSTKKNVWDYIDPKMGTIISTSRFEGQPLVISEAFYNCIPVVATNCLGQQDLLKSKNAFILDTKNTQEWSKILLKAITSKDERNEKRKFAKDWIDQFGDMKKYINDLLSAYNSIFNLY